MTAPARDHDTPTEADLLEALWHLSLTDRRVDRSEFGDPLLDDLLRLRGC